VNPLAIGDGFGDNFRVKSAQPPSKAKPYEVRFGTFKARVYAGTNTVGGKTYPTFTLVYQSARGTPRIRKRFTSLEAAKAEADAVARREAGQAEQVRRLTIAEVHDFVKASQVLKPLGLDVLAAAMQFAESARMLPEGVTVKEAVADYVRRNKAVRESRTVAELVREYIAAKETSGRSTRHVEDLRGRLKRFADAFQMPVASITGPMLQAYLDSRDVSARSKLNDIRHALSALRWGVKRKYAPRDLLDEIEAIELPEAKPSETLIFSPEELREMFASIRPELVPWLCMGAFCGLRSAEILRLDWQQVNLERRFVEVKAQNAKTAARRLVPLCDAAVEWLTPHRKESGRVSHFAEDNKAYAAAAASVNAAREAAGVKQQFVWKRNGLRHSFCSYRLAVTSDAAKTALEAGNSPAMIFRHYRQLVTADEAARWFSVAPTRAENVLPMPLAATA
jgi:integrase